MSVVEKFRRKSDAIRRILFPSAVIVFFFTYTKNAPGSCTIRVALNTAPVPAGGVGLGPGPSI